MQRFRERLPLIEEQPPVPRLWFLNQDKTELIQVQADRFIHNWRKIKGLEPYPRFEPIRDKFRDEVGVLERFLKDEGLGAPAVNRCEVTYVNHIEPSGIWQRHGQLEKVLANWTVAERQFLPEAEDGGVRLRFVIRSESGKPVGRLHVISQPAWKKTDNTPIMVLNLTARGEPLAEGIEGAFRFFELGRRWIVSPSRRSCLKEYSPLRRYRTSWRGRRSSRRRWNRAGRYCVKWRSGNANQRCSSRFTPVADCPNPFSRAWGGVDEVLGLPPGWNSYSAEPIESQNAIRAVRLLADLLAAETPAPSVVPRVQGGIQLEWHTESVDIETYIDSPDRVSFYTAHRESGDSAEGTLAAREEVLKACFPDYPTVADEVSLLRHIPHWHFTAVRVPVSGRRPFACDDSWGRGSGNTLSSLERNWPAVSDASAKPEFPTMTRPTSPPSDSITSRR